MLLLSRLVTISTMRASGAKYMRMLKARADRPYTASASFLSRKYTHTNCCTSSSVNRTTTYACEDWR